MRVWGDGEDFSGKPSGAAVALAGGTDAVLGESIALVSVPGLFELTLRRCGGLWVNLMQVR